MDASDRGPLTLLSSLLREGASGELICTDDAAEAHIFLLDGRIAWATANSVPNTMAQYLLRDCDVNAERLRDVVEECRRARKPFGETLIARGIVSREQVRAALRSQILVTISEIAGRDGWHAMFLPRRLDYSKGLTFAPDEILQQEHVGPAGTERVIDELRTSVPEASWGILASDGGDVLEVYGHPGPDTDALLTPLLETANKSKVWRCTARTARGTLLAGRVAKGWLVSAVAGQCNFARIQASFLGLLEQPELPASPVPASWSVMDPDGLFAEMPSIDAALQQSDELEAIQLSTKGRLAIVHRGEKARDQLLRVAGDFDPLPLLALENIISAGSGDEFLYPSTEMMLSIGGLNLFSARTQTDKSLWTTFHHRAPGGLGWALTKTLCRQMSR